MKCSIWHIRLKQTRSDHHVLLSRVTYQTLHTRQRVVGVVQRVGQLVDAIVGLAVAVEADAHCNAAKRGNTESRQLLLTSAVLTSRTKSLPPPKTTVAPSLKSTDSKRKVLQRKQCGKHASRRIV